MKSEGSASLSDSIIQQGQLKYLFLHWLGVFNPDNIQGHTMNLSRRRVRFRFQSFYVYSTWYLNQFEFYKRRSAVLKSQSIIEQPSHSMSSGPEQCGRPSQILMKFGTVVGLLTLWRCAKFQLKILFFDDLAACWSFGSKRTILKLAAASKFSG